MDQKQHMVQEQASIEKSDSEFELDSVDNQESSPENVSAVEDNSSPGQIVEKETMEARNDN